jgi:hypothetical protein
MSSINPTPCNQGILSDMSAAAQQIFSPIPPYPVFFDTSDCNGGGSLTNVSFPNFFCPMQCQSSSLPTSDQNCLRVIDSSEFKHDEDKKVDPNQVNKLPTFNHSSSNIFNDSFSRLWSFYVPPQYTIVFYTKDPSQNTKAESGPYFIAEPGTLYSNTCDSLLSLTDGSGFFDFDKYTNNNIDFFSCPEAACNCGKDDIFCSSIGENVKIPCRQNAKGELTRTAIDHRTPYFLVIRKEFFNDLILQMCLNQKPVNLGNNSLNEVWKPQSDGCDSYIESYCNQSNNINSDICACFKQKKQLDKEFGEKLDVPVCCFGKSTDGNIYKYCAFNEKAYKTRNMLQNCCSFAECQELASKEDGLQKGKLECDGSFIDFPPVPPSPTKPVDKKIITDVENIPFWVWILFGSAVFFIIAFVISLSFVT